MISGSSIMPLFSYTVFRTCSISSCTSWALAPPAFTTKPACFSDTCAPPTRKPFSPAWSISAAGKLPLGPLEGTAGGGQVERLLIPPPLIKVPHFGGDLLPVTRFQAQHGAENHTAGELFKKTAPIAEVAFVSRNLVQPLLRQIIADNALDRIFPAPRRRPRRS